MVAAGELGPLRAIHASYIQDWLTLPIDADGNKQAEWRTDPARAGESAVLADIGVHAYNLASLHLGRDGRDRVRRPLHRRPRPPPRRQRPRPGALDAAVPRGTVIASQTSPGHYNDLSVRVYGDKAGLEWARHPARRAALLALRRGVPHASSAAAMARRAEAAARLAHAGRPSRGLYRGLRQLLPRRRGDHPRPSHRRDDRPGAAGLVPDVTDGARGVKFVAAAVASHRSGGTWTAAS